MITHQQMKESFKYVGQVDGMPCVTDTPTVLAMLEESSVDP